MDDDYGYGGDDEQGAGKDDSSAQAPGNQDSSSEPWWRQHPGFAESLIPVWGSGREAVVDVMNGNWLGAGVNAALAGSDLFVGSEIAKGLAKGGFKIAGSHTWGATRKWMGKQGFLDAGQPGHHWLIPQNGWGKEVPDIVKNQPWNIKPMPSAEVHGRIHGPYAGKPQYNPIQGAMAGTPGWAKATVGADTYRTGAFAKKEWDQQFGGQGR